MRRWFHKACAHQWQDLVNAGDSVSGCCKLQDQLVCVCVRVCKDVHVLLDWITSTCCVLLSNANLFRCPAVLSSALLCKSIWLDAF